MEAPEKIWMTDEWVRQFDDKDFMGEDSVEYTRTDAFIEKACDFISNLRRLDDDVIEDFRKYMEGVKYETNRQRPRSSGDRKKNKIITSSKQSA